ncbi:spore cortex biosynthesis protein YabQ [Filobacillus milosensis]|uniref:Spore cortex biosynthesis protein YabQ n=1 Tax=Filobacillus milosensis TaxID=94137 RepID=A0A4Y8IJP1_9BACI|nr:spore cortex biosynthesis protein YabQ [Filobacillus milosensis]TFB21029.1 spore cortex biosynthesis protein YabQ [Filobacillus milosensis]
MNLDTQLMTLVTMVGAGVFVTAMFDTYKLLLRPSTYWNRVIVDTLFFLTQGCLIFYLLFLTNGGMIRFYLFLAVLLGISAYFALLQPVYIPLLKGFIKLFIGIVNFLKNVIDRLILQPVFWVIRLLVALIVGTLTILWKIIDVIYRLIILLIRPFIPKFLQKYLLNLFKTCSRMVYKVKQGIFNLWKNRGRKDDEADS